MNRIIYLFILFSFICLSCICKSPTNSNNDSPIECPEGYHPCDSDADTLTCCPDEIPATMIQTHTPWPGLADTPWPMYMHDPQHSGRSQYSGPALGEIEWAIPVARLGNTEIFTNPVIDPNGNIILSTRHDSNGNGTLFSISPNGIINWQVYLGSEMDSSPLIAADGSIYICHANQGGWSQLFLVKLDLTGNILWEKEFDLINKQKIAGNFSPNISKDGNVIYICGFDSTLTAVNSNGSIDWRFQANSPTKGAPSISPDGQSIYFISTDNELFSINTSGTKNWSTKFPMTSNKGNSCYPVIDSDGNLYLYLDGVMRSISPDGYIRWEDTSTFLYQNYLAGCSIGPNGEVFVTSSLYVCVYNYDGTLRWSMFGYRNQNKFTIDKDGNSYIGLRNYITHDNINLYSYTPSGQERYKGLEGRFTIAAQGCISSDNFLYIGSDDDPSAAFFKIR